MKILAKTIFGFKLYGTFVPESDTDYRGIYLPSKENCFLNRAKETITDEKEEDTQYFSLQYFLQLATQGQSIAIEMLAAPNISLTESSLLWKKLRENRKIFYTKNMHSFLGFAKSMAAKYSARVDRMIETENILTCIENHCKGSECEIYSERISNIWDILPESINAIKGINSRNTNLDNRAYHVCGRELQATARLDYAYQTIWNIKEAYGERVRNAKGGKVDWKSIAHAFRVALQAKEIVETGDLFYPLKDANYLRDMRLGKINFLDNELDKKLDDLIAEVQIKMDASNLPDKVDQKWCDEFILEAYN